MPETQSRCEFKRNSIDVGLGAAGKQLEQVLLLRVRCLPSSLFHSLICSFFQQLALLWLFVLLFGVSCMKAFNIPAKD